MMFSINWRQLNRRTMVTLAVRFDTLGNQWCNSILPNLGPRIVGMKGRPVGEPGALASLRRVRREGNPTLCRRPWPFERGTGAATPNGRRYFLELRYISHRLPPFGNGLSTRGCHD